MGHVHRAHPLHLTARAAGLRMLLLAACAIGASACTTAPTPVRDGFIPGASLQPPPALPDSTGFGVHVLSLAKAADGTAWAGTYGAGIFVRRPGEPGWERITAGDSTSISWDFVNAIALESDSAHVWYGTVGNGFGRSTDGGRTWRNWTLSELGPEWQYVVPGGVVVNRDTVYIATADGLRISGDGGTTWRCVQDAGRSTGGAAPREDGCTERVNALPTEYLLSLDVSAGGTIWVGHLAGLSFSRDAGRTWTSVTSDGIAGRRVRAVRSIRDSTTAVWAATESAVYVDSTSSGTFRLADVRIPGISGLPGAPRDLIQSPASLPPAIATSYGIVTGGPGGWRVSFVGAADRYRPAGDMWTGLWWGPPWRPIAGAATGLVRSLAGELPDPTMTDALAPAEPAAPRHLWFERPIRDTDGNPYIDPTYRYGSTMGGNFQQHQGVEFNNPAGTVVRAIGDGTVVFAGLGEARSNTIAILHDQRLDGQYVFSTYYHNTSLDVTAGQRVRAGDVIARVGNTGRVTNDHLHLEVHVAPSADSAVIVHPEQRFPPHTTNPQLWIRPIPGSGIVAGRVLDAAGEPVPGARIYGLVLDYPEETPFSFVETYRDRARGTPSYNENFAIGDVPAGTYTLGVRIGDRTVWRRVEVAEGQVTWVEFRP